MRAMKTLVISAVAVLGLLATTQVANAAPKKQTVKFSVTGDCKGEEEMIEDESDDNCKIVATISSASPSRSAVLEQLNDDDEWDEAAKARSKAGKVSFKIDATDEDDLWLDGDFTFRVVVAKSGSNKAYTSKEYTFTFTPAESTDEDEDSGSGEASSKQKGKSTGNTKLDTVLDKMDDKNTTFDDDCKKSFGADCTLMFTSTGPNWSKLTAAKWQPMCEKLLKQSAANCKLMYGKSAPPPGSDNQPSSGGSNNQPSSGGSNNQPSSGGSNNQPTSGGSNNQPTSGGSNNQPTSGGSNNQPTSGGSNNQPTSGGVAITAESIKKACTTAGIADCTAIVKLMMDGMAAGKAPDAQEMNKLLGTKMDAFLKAMGFPSQPSTKK